MQFAILSSLILLASPVVTTKAGTVITNAIELTSVQATGQADVKFDISGTVVLKGTAGTRHFSVKDGSGSAYLTLVSDFPRERLKFGDRVRVRGATTPDSHGFAYALCDRIEHIGAETGPMPVPRDLNLRALRENPRRSTFVRLVATVNDIFFDEITPKWIYLDLVEDDAHVIAALIPDGATPHLEQLIGVRVALTGICTLPFHNDRTLTGAMIYAHGIDSLVPLQNPLPDPFAVPDLPRIYYLRPEEFKKLGRVRDRGVALAVWDNSHLLFRSESGDIRRVDLLQPSVPPCGSGIEVVGAPETDLYRINFSKAIWRAADGGNCPQATGAAASSLDTLFRDENGEPCIRTQYHGQLLDLVGIIRSLPSAGDKARRLFLESGRFTMPVDVSACTDALRDLAVGSTVRVRGICVVDLPNWQPNCVIPRIKEVFVSVRTPSDITILQRPPWWTPARALGIVSVLVLVILGVFLWNLLLQRLAERRGCELARESIAHAESDLKTFERTRLAVELHDSLSQSLTGIAMEIEAALQFKERAQTELLRHLDIAWRTLRSCRAELRNCLWDLRNHALEEKDMENAIRRTLLPHLESVRLTVRFMIPREKFTDNTAHAILRIIRELTVNAIRHGKASEIKVAGKIEDGTLRCSVRDNGCGFDPQTAFGVAQGHFGLQGIRERLNLLNGTMKIERIAGGGGMRVSFSLQLPREIQKE